MTNEQWTALTLARDKKTSQADVLAQVFAESDALVIGIGAGMSASDGYTYVGDRFTKNFPDFIEKYNFLDMLQASLHSFESWQEYWAFQSRFVKLNFLEQPVGPSYLRLRDLLKYMYDYFIITTNADNGIEFACFDESRVLHMQGKYILWQCSQHCHAQTYRDEDAIREMVAKQENMKVPYELIPRCPKCDAPMEINKRKAEVGMVEDEEFHEQLDRYNEFLEEHKNDKVAYLEIGVGYTTPQFIKHPFHRMTRENPNAVFVTLNKKAYHVPKAIQDGTIHLDKDISFLIKKVHKILAI